MTTGLFHLYTDGKTVREISREEWQMIWTQDQKNQNTRLLCSVSGTEVYFRKGENGISIPMRQLKKVLGEVSK